MYFRRVLFMSATESGSFCVRLCVCSFWSVLGSAVFLQVQIWKCWHLDKIPACLWVFLARDRDEICLLLLASVKCTVTGVSQSHVLAISELLEGRKS